MNESIPERKDEEAWLAALAGREDAAHGGMSAAQASSLRKALRRRQERLEAEVPAADSVLFSQILDAVHDQRAKEWAQDHADSTDASLLAKPAGARRSRQPWVWGAAASVALATVLSWNLLVDTGVDESQVLRGAQDTVLIDPDPSARLAQLQTLLEGAGSKPEVRIEKSGTVVITVAETPQVLDALTAERIFPQPVGGKIVLVIEKPAQRKP